MVGSDPRVELEPLVRNYDPGEDPARLQRVLEAAFNNLTAVVSK